MLPAPFLLKQQKNHQQQASFITYYLFGQATSGRDKYLNYVFSTK
jgi:hypothetical protein